MTENEFIALRLYQQGLPTPSIEAATGIDRPRLLELFSEHGYDANGKKIIDEQDMVEQYILGDSMNDIAKTHDVSLPTVLRILKKHGVANSFIFEKSMEDDLIDGYRNMPSMAYWARHYNISPSVIKRILIQNNEPLVSNSDAHRKYHFKHNVFDKIDTEEKAYWLGFMFADGTVGSSRDDVKIDLSERDIEHVQKFADFVGYKRQLNKPILSVRSKEMKAALVKHGCLPRKSHIDVQPENVPVELHRHFMRGVCDGDGYIGVYAKSASIEIVGGRTLLQWMVDHGLPGEVRPHKTIWRIRSKSNNVLEWGVFLYEDANIYLDRKYDKYLKMKELFGVK